MPTDAMTALLLDPFLTYEEAVKQVRATPAVSRVTGPTPAHAAAPNRPTGASRRPARVGLTSVPVLHHPPATAG
jgi:hypothetical protein